MNAAPSVTKNLPPGVRLTGSRIPKCVRVFDGGELVRLNVGITKQDVGEAFSFVIVPETLADVPTPVRMPDPIALHNLVHRAESDFARFHGLTVVSRAAIDIAGNSLGTGKIRGPFHQVAISKLEVTIRGFNPADRV